MSLLSPGSTLRSLRVLCPMAFCREQSFIARLCDHFEHCAPWHSVESSLLSPGSAITLRTVPVAFRREESFIARLCDHRVLRPWHSVENKTPRPSLGISATISVSPLTVARGESGPESFCWKLCDHFQRLTNSAAFCGEQAHCA